MKTRPGSFSASLVFLVASAAAAAALAMLIFPASVRGQQQQQVLPTRVEAVPTSESWAMMSPRRAPAAAMSAVADSPLPSPTPVIVIVSPRPTATSFSGQIENMLLIGSDWLFQTITRVVIGPILPILTFLAWMIASFVLGIAFLRRFSDNKGVDPEQLVRWGIRSVTFMVVVGSAPYLIDVLSESGKFLARPIAAYNRNLILEFDAKMREYVRRNFAAEDPNALLAERLPDGSPGLVGVIFDKESGVRDVTAEMNILGWDMNRLFTLMVIGQNVIKFGEVFLALAGLFIVIALKLSAPVMSAFGFDEKFAGQIFYPFCWGVATFALAFPIVKEITAYVAYGIGFIGLSIYNHESVYTLDPVSAQIITSPYYDPASAALIVTLLFFVASLCYILVPWLSYRVLRGQVFEGVSQISMGWMLSSVGTALESYGLVAGAAINRQAENTQIQGIYNAEQAGAKKSLEAANVAVDARRETAISGVQANLMTSLGQIRANQVTQTLLADANRTYSLAATQAATRRETSSMEAEGAGVRSGRVVDMVRDRQFRNLAADREFGNLEYDLIPGGTEIAGTNVPVRKGVEMIDWFGDVHPVQESTRGMNEAGVNAAVTQNNLNENVTAQRVEASQNYQSDMNMAIDRQGWNTISALDTGAQMSSGAVRAGAQVQLGGIERSASLDRSANQLNFEARVDAAGINRNAASEAAHLRMMSAVVSGFFRDMDRRLEEMKPKY